MKKRYSDARVLKEMEDKKWVVGDCWRYLGSINNQGYGHRGYKGRIVTIHRLSMHLFRGFDLDSELEICHLPNCKYRDCWNPDHLRIDTHLGNCADRIKE